MSETAKEDPGTPPDPYRLVYIIFYWLGVGTLLPWNFFISVPGKEGREPFVGRSGVGQKCIFQKFVQSIYGPRTATGYWMHKWRTVEPEPEAVEAAVVVNETIEGNETAATGLNEMQTSWGPYLAIASMVPNVTILLLNAAFGHHFRFEAFQ